MFIIHIVPKMSNYKLFQKQGGTQERERKRDRERGGGSEGQRDRARMSHTLIIHCNMSISHLIAKIQNLSIHG